MLALWPLCTCSGWDWLFCSALGIPEIPHHPLKQYRTYGQTLSSTMRYRNRMNRSRHLVKRWPSSAKACSIYVHETKAEDRSSLYRSEREETWFGGYLSSSMMTIFLHLSNYVPFSKAMKEPCTQTSKFSIKYGKEKTSPHFIFYTVSSFQAYTCYLLAQKIVICSTASDQHNFLKEYMKKG